MVFWSFLIIFIASYFEEDKKTSHRISNHAVKESHKTR